MRAGIRPPLGTLAWCGCFQFFVVERLVSLSWPFPYRWTKNFISDLGALHCGQYGDRDICSPAHAWMNASFCLQAVLIAVGALLLLRSVPLSGQRLYRTGLGLIVLSSIGLFLVGLAPEDAQPILHVIGATVQLVGGNLALVLVGIARYRSSLLGKLALLAGVLALGALVLLVLPPLTLLAAGTLERIAAYPLPLWLVAQGLAWLRRASPL